MTATKSLETLGCLGQVTLEGDLVRLKGWSASWGGGLVLDFRINIGGLDVPEFRVEKGLISQDVQQLFPSLDHADQARFLIYIPLSWIQQTGLFNSLVRLTPIFASGEGDVLFGFLEPSLPVPEKSDQVGVGGSFKLVAADFLGHFVNKANLQPAEAVLDAGCGVGRIAYGLAYYLNSQASYHGFDIVPHWIDWCQQVISATRPNFHFECADLYSDRYNPTGKTPAENFVFPYPNNQFNFVLLTSVFTHLYAAASRNYLQQIARVLKPGGRCLCTFFLLNDETESLIKSGRSSRNFAYAVGESFIDDPDNPEDAIAHSEALVMDWIKDSGLSVQRQDYGMWCRRSRSASYQDMLVLCKN
ncbi:class I SAM-dependent methyltransferase [Limnospira fusiformis]|uniref:class I SAM-dependent methyltransferase n=1 Tax=Limnospira fusiformis TaxID=54297 RepID=UPI00144A0600|nr:class I SAM-dependent methyltransferase [Limnospira fusiformis SAG 85.79]